MKCNVCRQLLFAYLEDEVSQGQRMEIETHLLSCGRCSEVLSMLEEETDTLKRVLNKPALPDDFAEHLVKQLTPFQPVPLPQPEVKLAELSSKRSRNRFRSSHLRQITASLILVLSIAVVSGYYISPTFAAYISSFISRIGGEEGLKRAAEQGYSIPVNQATSSNGVTFRVRDIVADENRLVVSYVLEDANGKILPDLYIPDFGGNEISLRDKDGKVLYPRGLFNRGDDYADYTFTYHNPPEDVIIHFDIHSFGSKEPIPVEWQLDIPINLKKNLAASKMEQIGATFEAPGGVKFELSKVTYTPSAARLDIATDRTELEKERVRQMAQRLTGKTSKEVLFWLESVVFSFRIVNQEGEVIAQEGQYDMGEDPVRTERSIYFRALNQLDNKGRLPWIAAYVPGPDSEQLTFILDAVMVQEESTFAIDIHPEQLEKGPINKEYPELNRSYTLKKIRKGIDPDTQKSAWAIDMEVVLPKGEDGWAQGWNLYDTQGNRFETKLDYEKTIMVDDTHMKLTIIVPELKDVSGPMKLALKTYWKRYDQLNWRVPIPQER
ncbi:DUF4179 domain-containing protein [Brevibacillus sp. SYSU BS000544]|uniref:DUF4179 domain-containing protein n=1 Tax=Brevibacillus sp. SYSU BS000544 TaxID=3416443 RepID=UPI003CE512D4